MIDLLTARQHAAELLLSCMRIEKFQSPTRGNIVASECSYSKQGREKKRYPCSKGVFILMFMTLIEGEGMDYFNVYA